MFKTFRRHLLARLLAVSAVLAVAVAGCGGSGSAPAATPKPAAPAGQQPAAEKPAAEKPTAKPAEQPKPPVTIKVGVPSWKGDAGFWKIAEEKGFYKEENVTVEWVENDSSSTLTKAVIGGSVDIALISPGNAISSVAAGSDAVLVGGGGLVGLPHVLYATKDIKTAKDLEGKQVGVSSPGSLPHELVALWMIKEGADYNKITIVNAGGSSGRVQALLAGKIQASASTNDFIPMMEEKGGGKYHVPVRFGQVLPDYIRVAYVTTRTTLGNKEDGLYRFLKASSKGFRYSVTHRDEVNALSAKITDTKSDDPGIQLAYDTQVGERLLHPDLDITKDQVKYMIDAMVTMGSLKQPLPVEKVFEPKLMERVQQELGKWKW